LGTTRPLHQAANCWSHVPSGNVLAVWRYRPRNCRSTWGIYNATAAILAVIEQALDQHRSTSCYEHPSNRKRKVVLHWGPWLASFLRPGKAVGGSAVSRPLPRVAAEQSAARPREHRLLARTAITAVAYVGSDARHNPGGCFLLEDKPQELALPLGATRSWSLRSRTSFRTRPRVYGAYTRSRAHRMRFSSWSGLQSLTFASRASSPTHTPVAGDVAHRFLTWGLASDAYLEGSDSSTYSSTGTGHTVQA